MNKKNIFFSSLFPIISVLSCIIYVICFSPFLSEYGFKYAVNTLIFAGVFGGIIPLIVVLVSGMDISFYIKKKMIFSIIYVVFSIASWMFIFTRAWSFLSIAIPCIMIVLEIKFSISNGKNTKEKIVIFLSSPMIPYCGMFLDICHAFTTTVRF